MNVTPGKILTFGIGLAFLGACASRSLEESSDLARSPAGPAGPARLVQSCLSLGLRLFEPFLFSRGLVYLGDRASVAQPILSPGEWTLVGIDRNGARGALGRSLDRAILFALLNSQGQGSEWSRFGELVLAGVGRGFEAEILRFLSRNPEILRKVDLSTLQVLKGGALARQLSEHGGWFPLGVEFPSSKLIEGVNPWSLIPDKDLRLFSSGPVEARRMQYAEQEQRFDPLRVNKWGLILDGNHRLLHALINDRFVDVVVVSR